MDNLIKAVKTFRLSAGLAERLRLAEEILNFVEPCLRRFVFGKIDGAAADDALQEILRAIATSLKQFRGETDAEFWGWCYGIARNKLNDQFRRQAADRLVSMPPEDLGRLVDTSATLRPLSPAEAHDFKLVMAILAKSQPGCYQLLWKHYITGLDYSEIAKAAQTTYDAARMQVSRCLKTAQSLLA